MSNCKKSIEYCEGCRFSHPRYYWEGNMLSFSDCNLKELILGRGVLAEKCGCFRPITKLQKWFGTVYFYRRSFRVIRYMTSFRMYRRD